MVPSIAEELPPILSTCPAVAKKKYVNCYFCELRYCWESIQRATQSICVLVLVRMQNGESSLWLGCHTHEHNVPTGECRETSGSLGQVLESGDGSRLRSEHQACSPDTREQQLCEEHEQRQRHRDTAAHLRGSSICKNYFHALFYEQEVGAGHTCCLSFMWTSLAFFPLFIHLLTDNLLSI